MTEVDSRPDRMSDRRTEVKTSISHPAISRSDKNEPINSTDFVKHFENPIVDTQIGY